MTSVDGDFLVRPARVTDEPSALGSADVVLLGVKAWQVPQAAEAMRPLVGERTFVVPLQNGIEAPEQLADVFGASRVLGGLCRILAYVEGPGHIRHAGVAPYIAFGELDASSSPRVEALRQAFSRARGVTAEVPPDIRAAMWSKFVFIAALGGVGALTRAPIGVIRSQPESRRLLEQALEEIYAVAVGNRHRVAGRHRGRRRSRSSTTCPPTARLRCSGISCRAVLRSSRRRWGPSCGWATGEGIAVPLHRLIYAALLPLERRARGELEFHHG